MSGYRKRRSSVSLESEGKRMSFERYDIKQEYNPNGRSVRSAVVYKPHRYYNSHQYVEPDKYLAGKRSQRSSTRNYSAAYDNEQYNCRRETNVKQELYIDSLRQVLPRCVNFSELRRHLSQTDIRRLRNWNYATALDLTLEMESSLKYFVDTRNELVFLRKLERQQYAPFTYKDIHVANASGLQNRIQFLENESAYLSNRVNQLFYQLQSVVIPSMIDDITFMHSVLYKNSWTDRARYWYGQFKKIKWANRSRDMSNRTPKYQQSHRHRGMREDKVNVAGRLNVKSEAVDMNRVFTLAAKSVKVEKPTIRSYETMSKIEDTLKTLKSEPTHASNSEWILRRLLGEIQELADAIESGPSSRSRTLRTEQPQVDEVEGNESLDENDNSLHSCELIEPKVCTVTVPDDE